MLGFVVSSFKFSWLREGTCNALDFMQVRGAHRFAVGCWGSSYLIKVCTELIAELSGGEDLKRQQNKLGRGLESFLVNFEVELTALYKQISPSFLHKLSNTTQPLPDFQLQILLPQEEYAGFSLSPSAEVDHIQQTFNVTCPKIICVFSLAYLRREHTRNRNYPMSQLKSCSELTGKWTLTKKKRISLVSKGCL